MAKIPSPCIDVCKHKLGDHCIGCSMTRAQKREQDGLKGSADKLAFLVMLVAQQAALGKFRGWETAYRRKCAKKGVACPLDTLVEAPAAQG